MIESPRSTLPTRKAQLAWLLAASWLLATPGLSKLWADEDGLFQPTWKMGLSQWTGSGYLMPDELPEPRLSDTPSDPLPYTMPVDPTDQTVAKRRAMLHRPDDELSLTLPNQMLGDNDAPPYSAPWSAAMNKKWESAEKSSSSEEPASEPIPALPPPESRPAPGLVKPVAPPDPPRSFSDRIRSRNTTGESAPLDPDVRRWYHYPRRWVQGWTSHAQIGLNGSEGNANTLALQTGLELRRKRELSSIFIDVDYRQATESDVTVVNYGRLKVDVDRKFRDSKFSLFSKFGMTWDQFKPFDLQLWINGGAGYHWIRTPRTTLITQFGGGAMREFAGPDDSWVPEAVFSLDFERRLTARQRFIAKCDYYPAWEKFSDFRMIADLAWEMLLDGTNNLSIRISATDRYDSTPNGAQANDVYYSSLLMYKF